MFLAGGFGASPWLFQEVGRKISTELLRPDINTYVCLLISVRSIHVCTRNKAVAVGAVSYYLDHPVVGRLVKCTYGIPTSIPYNHSDPEHRKRAHQAYLGIIGVAMLDVFRPILFKVGRCLPPGCSLGTKPIFRGCGYRVRRSSAKRCQALL